MSSKARRAGAAVGRFLGAGLAGTAKAGATGVALYVAQRTLAQKVQFLQQKPLAGPIGMIVLGHIAKKKFPTLGTAGIGAGAYGLALAYDLNRMQTQSAAPKETGALIGPNDIGALIEPTDIRGIEYESAAPSMSYGDALSI